MNPSRTKKQIIAKIKQISEEKGYIKSTTIVGSFLQSKGLEDISDIDVIIIVDELSEDKYNNIVHSFKNIDVTKIGLEGYELVVNPTFGPLKFDLSNRVVFHVMIYDIDGHIKHVNESPFTCYSWENYKPVYGHHLKEIYPTLNLQLSDLMITRRSLNTYIEDIDNGVISYRKYEFKNNKPYELKETIVLDSKHKNEYAYHITYHLFSNLYKILTQDNSILDDIQISSFFSSFSSEFKPLSNLLGELHNWKKKNGTISENILPRTKEFIENFFKIVSTIERESISYAFYRHEETIFNDGTFLGLGRNPPIIYNNNLKYEDHHYQVAYGSRLLRSQETIAKYFNFDKLIETELLNEINYGDAEGLSIDALEIKFPLIIEKWKSKEDPKFPSGESQKDVLERVNQFFNSTLDKKKNSVIISHLVVLRMILYKFLSLHLSSMFKVKIDHLEYFQIFNYNGHLVIQLDESLRKKIRHQLSHV